MNDNNKRYPQAHVHISPDEFSSGHRALRIIDLAVFLYRHAGRETIVAAGHDTDTFVDMIEDHIQTAKSCFTASPHR